MVRELHDHYFREAKREGYLSRAAYKLIEIDDRKRILSRGDRVLDFGCAPGSWLQVAARRVGPKGLVVGVDLTPVRHQFREQNIRSLVGDLHEIDPRDLTSQLDTEGRFDVILSDLAPNTTGDRTSDHYQSIRLCERVLELCPLLLREGGRLVMKVFEGEAYPELLRRVKDGFERVKGFKPKASREMSREMYIIGSGYQS